MRLFGLMGSAASLLFLGGVFLCQYGHAAISKNNQKHLNALESNIDSLEEEIEDLQLSASSLDGLRDKLASELTIFEKTFRAQMEEIVVPLLSWPDNLYTLHAGSWIEFERASLLLGEVRRRLLSEPLGLIADRELRIGELDLLREELSESLTELESKQGLLSLQIEELHDANRRTGRFVPHATAATKKHIGDIEGNP